MTYQTQPQEFRPIDDKDAKTIADCCPNSGWALNFLRMMSGSVGYAYNIRYLMRQHEGGTISEDDMVHLCTAVRFCYGIVLAPA